MREAWLSIVAAEVAGAAALDLFAGSGALGIEALSRGAASCDFVEMNAASLRALGANLDRVAAGDAARVRRGDALRFIETLPAYAYDLAFADPPYTTDAAERVAERWLAVPFARVLGVEHDARVTLPGGGDSRKYGTTRVTFYRADESAWASATPAPAVP